ncbi:MAG: hypothetical protein RL701_2752 [Pseudomonadota bacterium]
MSNDLGVRSVLSGYCVCLLLLVACGNGSTGGSGMLDASAPGDGSTETDAPVTYVGALCGNGEVDLHEGCDDGNDQDGDGCSGDCTVEQHYDCHTQETCVYLCGNGLFDADEACDDGNTKASDGCSAQCQVETGWGCARPGSECVRVPVCGNSVRERGEECDSGPTTDPGCAACKTRTGFLCAVAGQACIAKVCGDGVRTPDEACDDGDTKNDDGCSDTCSIETGWRCSSVGCQPICGDKLKRGGETCEDGNTLSGDGCSAGCAIEPGANCDKLGEKCGDAVCGNKLLEGGEGCDDGNLIGGDGCGPTCQLEPKVTVGTNPVVQTRCGDGLLTSGESCDDGNVADGDGCSASCKVESGFSCVETIEDPESVRMKVTYRDFKQRDEMGGHPHMLPKNGSTPASGNDPGIVGSVCNTSNGNTCGRLDADGKPQLTGNHATVNANDNYPNAFALWYRDTNPNNVVGASGPIMLNPNPAPVPADGDFLTLMRDGSTKAYSFDSGSFFPLNGRGFGNTPGEPNNFHFTTELRSFFQYKGGETLTFRGDDDVWVFINGRLAVDIGGIHGPEYGRVVLGDDGMPGGGDSDCTVNFGGANAPAACAQSAAESGDTSDSRFGLTKGGVYEIVLFNAERHPTGSNFHLTLSGFLAPRSYCTPVCGDGKVVGWETCDSGKANADNVYGVCNKTCSAIEYCGDNIKQSAHEACDNGFNLDGYAGNASACGPGCKLPPACGDGVVQAPYELCDKGSANNDTAYDGCTTSCAWGPYCGDGKVQAAETCDEGVGNVAADEAGSCGYDCQPAYLLF